MRERKYIKFRVDMYEDTKFKIIDRRPERDLIHYIWTRFVTLAGKVNLDGDLYMSRNIKYTVETLAIEFNREVEQIELALDVLIELEMMELTDDKVYRVKNFTKHQNIKVKEKIKLKDNEENVKNKEILIKDVLVKEDLKNEIDSNQDKETVNKVIQNRVEEVRNDEIYDVEIIHKGSDKVDNNTSKKKDDNMGNEKTSNSSQDISPMLLDMKNDKNINKNKNKNQNKKKNSNLDVIDEETKDDGMICFYDGDIVIPLKKGESVTKEWSF